MHLVSGDGCGAATRSLSCDDDNDGGYGSSFENVALVEPPAWFLTLVMSPILCAGGGDLAPKGRVGHVRARIHGVHLKQ